MPIMGSRYRKNVIFTCGLLWLSSPPLQADPARFSGTRATGMAGALRAAATGDLAPLLNPSGMSLARSYTVTSAYQYIDPYSSHDFHLSAVDSTSASNVGGGIFYTHHRSSTEPNLETSGGIALKDTGHQGGISLSFPFADKLFIGITGKYIRGTFNGQGMKKGFTYDAGITLRPISILSVGVVGQNLKDLGMRWTPRTFGAGVAVIPMPILLFAFDVEIEKISGDATRDQATYYMGGGELMLGQTIAVRAGGGQDGYSKNTYFSLGFSAIQAGVGSLDFGFRRDISGKELTTFSVSARLFVPAI
jgi:hypothetical protein